VRYAATATPAYPDDLIEKFRKAASLRGTRVIHLLTPCPPGWKIPSEETVRYGRLAVGCRAFPLIEVEDGRSWRITREPEQLSIEDYLRGQGRFRNLMEDKPLVALLKQGIEERWRHLLDLAASAQ